MYGLTHSRIKAFHKKILAFYRKNGRHHLPFRKTTHPYRIFVSEIMLQQTQVDRVLPFYSAWIDKWPSFKPLSKATPREVLSYWSGLGYNKRALNLLKTSREIVHAHKGKIPTTINQLESLPGIGPYSARAILIFAFNKNLATVDTNIRRVLIHELRLSPRISQKHLWQIAEQTLPRGKSRMWHNALMDYAALALPKTPHIRPLSRQKAFKGSVREIRGELIRQLNTKKRVSYAYVAKRLSRNISDVKHAAWGLKQDGLIQTRTKFITLAG